MKIIVKGMHCASCEKLIQMALDDEGIKVKSLSYKTGELETENGTQEQVRRIVKSEGYDC